MAEPKVSYKVMVLIAVLSSALAVATVFAVLAYGRLEKIQATYASPAQTTLPPPETTLAPLPVGGGQGGALPLPRPKPAEVVTIPLDLPDQVIWSDDETCVVLFEGSTCLYIDPSIGAVDGENPYAKGEPADPDKPFPVQVRLLLDQVDGGCDGLEDCFSLIPASQCDQVLSNLDQVARRLGANSFFNGGVPYIPEDAVVPYYWDGSGRNISVRIGSDCSVSVEQL